MEKINFEDKNKLNEDILRMFYQGSLNDVKIRLSDGDINANKDILIVRSEYFSTMFKNSNFIEGETNSVDMSHCSKVVMEKIIKFFFSGEVTFIDLCLAQLLELSRMSEMMLLVEFKEEVDDYIIKGILPNSGDDAYFLPELISGLKLANQYNLVVIKETILGEIYSGLKGVPIISNNVKESESFETLEFSLIKDIFLFGSENDISREPSAIECLNAFMHWLSENDITEEQKTEIVESFDFEDFSLKELLTSVRDSGLYSVKKIDERVLNLFKDSGDRGSMSEVHELRETIESVSRFIPRERLAKIRWLLKSLMEENSDN